MKPASRETEDDWQRLRRDKRSAVVVLAVIVAGLAALLAVLGICVHPTRTADRSSPLYWALMLPFAWWAASLANYTKWAVRSLRPAAVAAIFGSLLALALALYQNATPMPWLIAAVVATSGGAAGLWLFSGSLLSSRGR